MKKILKTTTILIALITYLWGNTIVIQALAAEKWESNMKKDFAKVLREKKRPAEKHRDFVRKWQEEGRLPAVLTLYESQKENRQPSSATIDAAFYYGLGYTHTRCAPQKLAKHLIPQLPTYNTPLRLPQTCFGHISILAGSISGGKKANQHSLHSNLVFV